MKKSVGIGMYKISNSSQEILEKMLGKRYKDIVNMDCDEEISYIQKRNNRKLIFSGKVDISIYVLHTVIFIRNLYILIVLLI